MPITITQVEPKPVDFKDLQEGIIYKYVGSKYTTKYIRVGDCTVWLQALEDEYHPEGRIGTYENLNNHYDGKFEPVPVGTTIRIEI